MSPGLQHMSTAVVRAVAEQTGVDPIALVREALADAGMNYISFVVKFPGGGRVVLHLIELGPAVEVTAGGIGLGSLGLVEGAVPELGRLRRCGRPRRLPPRRQRAPCAGGPAPAGPPPPLPPRPPPPTRAPPTPAAASRSRPSRRRSTR